MRKTRKRKITWVVVGDASRARIFRAEGRQPWMLVHELDHPESREHINVLLSDRQGRVTHGNGSHSAMDAHTEPHEVEAIRFARVLADRLEAAHAHSLFDEIVVVAPPHFLGLLRSTIDAEVQKRVRFSLPKDYCTLDPRAVRARLQGAGVNA